MKIGQFAKINDTSIDTIRHYMSLGLLLPEKNNSQYEFDAQCQNDYLKIQRLKGMGFSLSEIHYLMLYMKMGKLTGYNQRMSYLSYFENKKIQISNELKKLESMRQKLELYVDEIKETSTLDGQIDNLSGIKLSFLDFLRCPKCSGEYQIASGHIANGELQEAMLKCCFGSELFIKEGIIYVDETVNDLEHFKHSEENNLYSEMHID